MFPVRLYCQSFREYQGDEAEPAARRLRFAARAEKFQDENRHRRGRQNDSELQHEIRLLHNDFARFLCYTLNKIFKGTAITTNKLNLVDNTLTH